MENAPIESLTETLNHIKVFYDFTKYPEPNGEAIFYYLNKYSISIASSGIVVFLCNESLIKRIEGFEYLFIG